MKTRSRESRIQRYKTKKGMYKYLVARSCKGSSQPGWSMKSLFETVIYYLRTSVPASRSF